MMLHYIAEIQACSTAELLESYVIDYFSTRG